MDYKQRWLEYFEVLDADGNGFIDPGDIPFTEKVWSAALNLPIEHPDVQQAISGIIRDFDTNKDGMVSKEELLAGVEKYFVGKTPDTLPDWWQSNCKLIFESSDKKKIGELTRDVVDAYVHRVVPDADTDKAYEWACAQSSSGKFDAEAIAMCVFRWATEPETPEGMKHMMAFMRKPKAT